MTDMNKEVLEEWSLLTGDTIDIRYTGVFGEVGIINHWDFEQEQLVSRSHCRAQGKDDEIEVGGRMFLLPDGVNQYLATENHEHALPQAEAFILGYKARLEWERLHEESNVLMKVACGLGKDLRFTGEVTLDVSVHQADPMSGKMKNILSAKAKTQDGRSYNLIDPDSKNAFLSDKDETLLLIRAKAYTAGYMSRVRKEELLA